ncbi:MAG: phosphoglycerate kinase, partial [Candidatus Coatesbacteria bacterium]|nr:phosphoglycerate kinase [Candidatus Coatesbacteria bacterium]
MIAGLSKKTVSDADIGGKRVFLRVDFNVPIDSDGNILDDTRIKAHLKTINHILSRGAKLILASHFGRPKGKVVPSMSLVPVAKRLNKLLDGRVRFISQSVGEEVESAASELQAGEILLLENLRFNPGETENSPELA